MFNKYQLLLIWQYVFFNVGSGILGLEEQERKPLVTSSLYTYILVIKHQIKIAINCPAVELLQYMGITLMVKLLVEYKPCMLST